MPKSFMPPRAKKTETMCPCSSADDRISRTGLLPSAEQVQAPCLLFWRLEQAGADALCLGCNTAHFYYNALAAAIGIPIFHMPRLAGTYCQHKRLHKVILLAAPGTYETGIYEKAFSGTGVEIIRPEPAVQRLTAQCIYEGIKACRRDYDAGALQAALLSLLKREQAPLLLGCTELPIAWRWYGLPGETIDPGEILAQAVVRWAQGGAGESFFPQPH